MQELTRRPFCRNSARVAAALVFIVLAGPPNVLRAGENALPVDASTLRGKVLCGYQGWFRCPGDASGLGWIHWSRGSQRISPQSVSFEMWPDLAEYSAAERFAAPGFFYPDGKPAELFSSDNGATVLRHFRWMQDYGIDGVWLQHFVVDLPRGPGQNRYASRLRVLQHVRSAATKTGRVWALAFDIAGMPSESIVEVLTRNWRLLVHAGIPGDARYVHEKRLPVVQVWGFYRNNSPNRMTAAIGNRLIDFFHAPGPYRAFVVGGGDWNWRRNPDPAWQKMLKRLDGYSPWNVGNYRTDREGTKHASTSYWLDDRRECERAGLLWLPVVYPGFNWKNLQRRAPGLVTIPRWRGEFLWEQFRDLAWLKVTEATVAMFDEVDEGTAIFKVTSAPPTQAEFVSFEGLPSDWYLRLTGEGTKLLSGRRPFADQLPPRE